MTHLDRRQWLKTAGLAGAFSMLGGLPALAETAAPRRRLAADTMARLSSNENPYGPSDKVRAAITDAFEIACRYPFSYSDEVRALIARRHGVTPDHIAITAGSTEGLKAAGLLYGMNGGEIVTAEPTFKALMTYAEQFGAYINWVPSTRELQHDLDAMEQRVTHNTSMVYICNPNNPTGTLLPGDRLRNFCDRVSDRTVVFVDEAYFDFIEDPNYPSMVELVREGQNVIVARTFSKVYGLAGLRIGYLIARPDIIRRIRDKRMAFTNILALAAAQAAMEDEAFYRFSLDKNAEARTMIYETLNRLGLRYIPSQTNFVFFESGMDITELGGALYQQGVVIGRPFPPFMKWCRISTGTIEETGRFCEALQKELGS